MKLKLSRILGVALIIALLTSMIVVATPASVDAPDESAVMTSELLGADTEGGPLLTGNYAIGGEVTPFDISVGGAYFSIENTLSFLTETEVLPVATVTNSATSVGIMESMAIEVLPLADISVGGTGTSLLNVGQSIPSYLPGTNEVIQSQSQNPAAVVRIASMAVLFVAVTGLIYILSTRRKTNHRKTERDNRFTFTNGSGTNRHPLKFPASA